MKIDTVCLIIVSDEDLLSLHSVFGVTLQKALDIFEKYPIFTVYITSKKKTLIEVKGDKDTYYRVFPKQNYCSCLAFKHLVLERKIEVTCKHILAARLAVILGKTVEHEVTQVQYLMLLKSMYDIKEENGKL